jgi:hypothetical protein
MRIQPDGPAWAFTRQSPDCKQVCIGLVVSKCGMPLGYEVFEGNRNDVKTWQEIVTKMEARYGKADRIWCGDRGMMSKANIEFMESENRRYIIGASKGTLKKFERELLEEGWRRSATDWKSSSAVAGWGPGNYILCRSRDRREKEKAMHDRFEKRIDEALEKVQASCQKRKWKKDVIDRRIGRIMAKNSRAAGLFEVEVKQTADVPSCRGRRTKTVARLGYPERGLLSAADQRDRLVGRRLVAGVHPVDRGRGGVSDPQERPAGPPGLASERGPRLAHILVCFLAYVLWKTLHQMAKAAGLGDEPRRIFDELGEISLVDVVLPTRKGPEIRRRCVRRPTDHQAILLERLGLTCPGRSKVETEM